MKLLAIEHGLPGASEEAFHQLVKAEAAVDISSAQAVLKVAFEG